MTPLGRDHELDVPTLERLVGRCLAAGVAAVSVGGSTGEGALLPEALRQRLVKATVAAVDGRLPVLAGVAGGPPQEVVAEAQRHLETGADAVLVPPPSYFELDQASVTGYYRRVASDCGGPVIAYHFPALTKVRFEPSTAGELAELPAVIGIKDSSGDPGYLAAVVTAVAGREDFCVFAGSGRVLTEAHAAGARGVVAASGNLIPDQLVALWKALEEGRTEAGAELQRFVAEVEGACRQLPFPVNWKAALEVSGLGAGPPAEPLHELAPAHLAGLRESLGRLHVTERSRA